MRQLLILVGLGLLWLWLLVAWQHVPPSLPADSSPLAMPTVCVEHWDEQAEHQPQVECWQVKSRR
jgi:hypothetical protein